MAKGVRNIEAWEAALIKTMLAEGKLTNDQIAFHFARLDRTVNPGRISEIKLAHCHAEVEPATPAQVTAYLRTRSTPGGDPRRAFFTESPLHPENLKAMFRLKAGTTDVLDISETDHVECKESLHMRGEGRAKFARTVAGFSNARGGFLLFGIRDTDMTIVGITPEQINAFDGATFNQFLSDTFAPVPLWETTEYAIGGKTIIVMYVREAPKKPVISSKNVEQSIREADIFYRYPSETRRIKYAELAALLEERTKATERRWADVLRQVEAAGVDNVAVLDTVSGEVTGRTGKFLIDEKLIPKLSFISEGHFSETEGAPTLRLVGDLEPISMTGIHAAETIVRKERLTDVDLLREFVDRAKVEHPRLYTGHLAHSTKEWLPVYFFMRQAGLDEVGAARLLSEEPDTKPKHVKNVVERVEAQKLPSMSHNCTAAAAEPERSALLSRSLPEPETDKQWSRLLKATITLQPGEIEPDYLLPLLGRCLDAFGIRKSGGLLIYAIAHVDVVWHQQIMASRTAGTSPSKPKPKKR